MVNRYRTKPYEIEAVQWKGYNLEEIEDFVGLSIDILELFKSKNYFTITIKTHKGHCRANVDDYIIKELNGEFYACNPDEFEKKYELID